MIYSLIILCLGHAFIDMSCAAYIFDIYKNPGYSLELKFMVGIAYLISAFGIQPILGLIIDSIKYKKSLIIASYFLVCFAFFLLGFHPILSIVLAGVGNALFHLSAGRASLSLTPGKATAPGIFVSTGAIGLFLGTLLGKNFTLSPIYFIAGALILSLALIKTNFKITNIKYSLHQIVWLPIILLLTSVLIRSILGLAIIFPWKIGVFWAVIFTLTIFLGKFLGGPLGDKAGWGKTGIITLVTSLILLVFFPNVPILAILGIFAFNITMPLTLIMVINLLPKYPTFAFGLTCLALFFGALPAYSGFTISINQPQIIFCFMAISVACFSAGSWLYFKRIT